MRKIVKNMHHASQSLLEKLVVNSLDLNPVEKFWGWVRKRLLELDLENLNKKRCIPSKQQYKKRVLQICNSKAAKTVANNYLLGLRNVCEKVLKKKGYASGT